MIIYCIALDPCLGITSGKKARLVRSQLESL